MLLPYAAYLSPSCLMNCCCYVRQNQEQKNLFKAIQDKNTVGVKALLEQGVDPNITDAQGRTPLVLGIRLNNTSIVELLLNHGAKMVNMIDIPLLGDSSSMLKLLLSKGLDPNIYLSGVSGRELSFPNGMSLLMQAAIIGNAEAVEILLNRGA